MNLKVLALPEPTTCPACDELIEQTIVVPVLGRERTQVKNLVVVCPNCGSGHDMDLDEIMGAAAREVMNHLSVAATLSLPATIM